MSESVVTTDYGQLRGVEADGVLSFKGIPFAAPPVGDRRWLAPQPPAAWDGVREATEFGPSAMQNSLGEMGEMIGVAGGPQSEDCLYLNVWTPALDERNRPVLVWIHGGGNTVGSGSQPRVNGEYLARHGDVVVVTFNYRMGAFGFLHAPELGASGNEALLDQVAALRWVRQEIDGFGGDSQNVTVFGQSAGGFDIAQLLAMPAAEGCFDKAVPMSGSLRPPVPAEKAHEIAGRFAEKFGGFANLRSVPAEELLAFQGELTGSGAWQVGPVLDGEVIVEDAAIAVGEGRYTKGMPLMIGTCRDEWGLWTGLDDRMAALDDEGLTKLASRILGDHAEEAIAAYRNARETRGEDTAPVALWRAMMTDSMFRMPAIRTAELHSAHSPETWMYLFEYESPAAEGRLGACHSLDIPFIWGTYESENMPRFCGAGPEVASLSSLMMDAYLAFARHGNPNNPGLPEWPTYDTAERLTMRLGPDPYLDGAPMDEERHFWAALPGD